MKKLFLLALFALPVTQQALAAPIGWSLPFEVKTEADIDATSGTIVFAGNVGAGLETDPLETTISGQTFSFVPVQPLTSNNTGAGGLPGIATTGNDVLDTVWSSHAWVGVDPPVTAGFEFTLDNLSIGEGYQVQIIAAADGRNIGLTERVQVFADTVGGTGSNSLPLRRASNLDGDVIAPALGYANSVLGQFTADATTQSIWISGAVDPGMSAYIVMEIGDVTPFAPVLTVDLGTGNLSLKNETGNDVSMRGYSITSSAGSLDQSGWTPVTGNFDTSGGTSDGSFDSENPWTILTGDGITTDLSEFELAGGDGGVLGNGETLQLGNAWAKTPTQDLAFTYTDLSGQTARASVSYIGTEIARGDLNGDGSINVDDWAAFLTGLNADLSGLTEVQAYQRGNLVGDDLAVTYKDFLEFKMLYDNANSQGAFAAMVASVPEPSTLVLLLFGVGLFTSRRTATRRR